jgi:hypothetical protein
MFGSIVIIIQDGIIFALIKLKILCKRRAHMEQKRGLEEIVETRIEFLKLGRGLSKNAP